MKCERSLICQTKIAKNKSDIPKNGFVLNLGVAKKSLVKEVAVGDYAFFDKEHNTVVIVSKDYNPFSATVLNYDGINVTRAENKLCCIGSVEVFAEALAKVTVRMSNLANKLKNCK